MRCACEVRFVGSIDVLCFALSVLLGRVAGGVVVVVVVGEMDVVVGVRVVVFVTLVGVVVVLGLLVLEGRACWESPVLVAGAVWGPMFGVGINCYWVLRLGWG